MIVQQLVFPRKEHPNKSKAAKKGIAPFFIKLFNWEYWSFGVIYTPIYFYWFYLSIRARSLFFFSASNPTIENGGFLMERKSDIYKLMPQIYFPKTFLVAPGYSSTHIASMIRNEDFVFPVIIKPDIGGKGRGVKKIDTIQEAALYIHECDFPMLVQEFVDYEMEAGIFYYRYPWKEKGSISGIVAKEFLTVIGNGNTSVEELLLQHPRYVLQLTALRKMKEIDLKEILKAGEEKVIVPFGNHARGAKFIDAADKINQALENAIDEICRQVPGFFYGRLDIKFTNWKDLNEGKKLSIIELNGAGSEPTHMYDPSHSLFFAWKEIIRHWKILWRISTWNHKNKKHPYLNFKTGIKMFKENKAVEKKLDTML
jgi:hypothetical protein